MNDWDIANKLCLLSASRAYSLQERRSDWLGLLTGPHTNGVDGKDHPVAQQSLDLLWVKQRTSAECMNVTCYSTFQDGTTNAAGKEAPQSPSPLTPDEHSLRNKSNLLKKCFRKLALAYDNPLYEAVFIHQTSHLIYNELAG